MDKKADETDRQIGKQKASRPRCRVMFKGLAIDTDDR